MNPSCSTCKFVVPGGGTDLACHFNPPQATVILAPRRTLQGDTLQPTPVTTWPLVRESEWCGKWEPQITLAS